MAKFTCIEEKLCEQIKDGRLRTSLAKLREAVEDIWAPDAPRIIRDYTDHGIMHSERISVLLTKLLDANDGRPISSQEMYLIAGGIYLHDIGMQCDVVKFPEIKTAAEKIGAKFDIEIKACKASDYSVEEQKAIRKNHQYLTAAWIDFAYRMGSTALGQAARTIPQELVDDLMDICKYHSTLPITDCPLTFRFDQTARKQLAAALLRFADELDIDANRVSIETIKNFSLHPRNSVYWWLHNRTKVLFTSRNVIMLTLRLHPDDSKDYGPYVYSSFVTEIQTKNKSILTILAQNGIPIVISSDSNVVEHERAERFPLEIVQALQELSKTTDPLMDLVNEIRLWLQIIRYEVSEPQKRTERNVDMVATLEQGTLSQRVLVRCIDGEIVPSDIEALDSSLDRKIPQRWLISDKRVSDLARKQAAEKGFRVFNLAEFMKQMIWGPYFDALTSMVEKDRIPSLYVDLSCYKQEIHEAGGEPNKDRHDSLDEYIDIWLKEHGKMHISILGEFGTGKTWFCRHYSYRQLGRYLQDPANERLPLLITLRSFSKAMTSQQLINDALLEQYKLPFVGSAFDVFKEMNRRGKLLLILDGFDEMARQVDYQTVVDNFWELAKLVDSSSKVILTSRTEYFRWAKESEKILGGEEYGRRTILLQPPKFEVLYLGSFNDEQIRQVMTRRLGLVNGQSVAERILKRKNLAEMARKPILIELLLAALDEVRPDLLEYPAHVYLYATNKLLLRNIDTQRTFTTTADKLFFLCELAWEMIESGDLRIHFTAIPERIKAYFGKRIGDQHELDMWDFDLRNQTLLHRDAAGYYEFAHKSLAEYFVAFKFAAKLGCIESAFTETYCEANGELCKMPIEHKDIIKLSETFGALRISDERMKAIKELLSPMTSGNAFDRLWEVIKESKGKSLDQVKYTGGNAATLLTEWGGSFRKADLAETVLAGANLSCADLTEGDLRNSCLQEITLEDCILENTDIRGADIGKIGGIGITTIGSLWWSRANEHILVGVRDGTMRFINTGVWQESFSVGGFKREVCSIIPVKDGKQIIIADRGSTAILWDLSEGKAVHKFTNRHTMRHQMAVSPDERYLACVGDGGEIVVFDIQLGVEVKEVKDEKGSFDYFHCVSFINGGKNLIAGSTEGRIMVWDITSAEVINQLKVQKERASQIHYIGSSDGCWIVRFAGSVEYWSGYPLSQVCSLNCGPSYTASLSHRHDMLAVGGLHEYIWLFRLDSRDVMLKVEVGQGTSAIGFSPDDLCLASGHDDGAIQIWDINPQSPRFGKRIKIFRIEINCQGLQISGAKGLEQQITFGKIKGKELKKTLMEYFSAQGAVLDENQIGFMSEKSKGK